MFLRTIRPLDPCRGLGSFTTPVVVLAAAGFADHAQRPPGLIRDDHAVGAVRLADAAGVRHRVSRPQGARCVITHSVLHAADAYWQKPRSSASGAARARGDRSDARPFSP